MAAAAAAAAPAAAQRCLAPAEGRLPPCRAREGPTLSMLGGMALPPTPMRRQSIWSPSSRKVSRPTTTPFSEATTAGKRKGCKGTQIWRAGLGATAGRLAGWEGGLLRRRRPSTTLLLLLWGACTRTWGATPKRTGGAAGRAGQGPLPWTPATLATRSAGARWPRKEGPSPTAAAACSRARSTHPAAPCPAEGRQPTVQAGAGAAQHARQVIKDGIRVALVFKQLDVCACGGWRAAWVRLGEIHPWVGGRVGELGTGCRRRAGDETVHRIGMTELQRASWRVC